MDRQVPAFLFETICDVEIITPSSYQKSYLTNELRKRFGKKLRIDPLLVHVEVKETKKLTNINNKKDYNIYATTADVKVKNKDINQFQRAAFANIMKKVSIK